MLRYQLISGLALSADGPEETFWSFETQIHSSVIFIEMLPGSDFKIHGATGQTDESLGQLPR